MSHIARGCCISSTLAAHAIVLAGLLAAPAAATQIDIHGPSGSVAFGSAAIVLPNGNFVVTDPNAGPSNQGAVHLYSPAGTLISSLTGSTAGDHVGNGYIVVLKNGNVVIGSPYWHNNGAAYAGAATWINGTTGLQGAVSALNSLVGSLDGDAVGSAIFGLSNGNYVVLSPSRTSGVNASAGAATWGNGSTGVSGEVTAANSLVGSSAGDSVGWGGNFARLSNGNYVVSSPYWANGIHANAGAVTWADGSTGLSGVVSASNSLVGTTTGDSVGNGFVTALTNGNYVVVSPFWSNGGFESVGAVTWANGSTGLSGPVSTSNSLIGTHGGDQVGIDGATALSNGNYVVSSPLWINGTKANAGAATWRNGSEASATSVSASNSLVGTTADDQVGSFVQALTNGNYVVQSALWTNGPFAAAGAATWGNGSTGISGAVTTTNSLVGSAADDEVGLGVTALTNGNYVVASNGWQNIAHASVGAVTWADGSTGLSGAVTSANSLVGSKANDDVGGVVALSNGNYVVTSPYWANGANANAGAVTWADGSVGLTGVVSTANSLVGSKPGDQVGFGDIRALTNGNYAIASPNWANGSAANAGAVTWASGSTGLTGVITAANSLVGTMTGDSIGSSVFRTNNGNYGVLSQTWHNVATISVGAETLGRGTGGTVGPIVAANSVRGTVAGGGLTMSGDYDNTRDTLIVSQPAANIVSLFKADLLFVSGFESGFQ